MLTRYTVVSNPGDGSEASSQLNPPSDQPFGRKSKNIINHQHQEKETQPQRKKERRRKKSILIINSYSVFCRRKFWIKWSRVTRENEWKSPKERRRQVEKEEKNCPHHSSSAQETKEWRTGHTHVSTYQARARVCGGGFGGSRGSRIRLGWPPRSVEFGDGRWYHWERAFGLIVGV